MSSPELDASQRAAVEIEPSSRQVVVSGPGSGKTEVVSGLVARLVQDEGLDPEFELLVVSFSRAAVHAVNRRLQAGDIQASAAVRTLDSLAQQVTREAFGEEITSYRVFDRRIERAIQALRAGAWDAVDDVAHLVVDEVQDVVGLRAEFLEALIESLPEGAGFTLLGDLAQAIYDFQLSPEHPTTSAEVLARLGAGAGVVRRDLTGSYRAGTREARAAVALRDGAGSSLENAVDEVADFVSELTPIVDEDLAALARSHGRTFAILTATNGEALMEVQDLWRARVPAIVRRPATAPVVDRWVAEVLADRPNWSFEDLLASVGDRALATDRWRGLRSWLPAGSRSLATRDISRRLQRAAIPAELVGSDPDVPVVSTIHRAKGLEFDTVVMAQYPPPVDGDREPAEVTRIIYVGLTRARFRLSRIERNRYPHILHRDHKSRRWLRSYVKKNRVKALEISGDDVDRSRPPGDDDLLAVQHHLRTAVTTGDRLHLEYDWTSGEVPYWRLQHEGVTVGRTTEGFGQDAKRLLWGRIDLDLKDVHVECIETVGGEPTEDLPGGIGRYGLWLGVRPVGFACREWKAEE
nr:UvrD-helicase domain-containing protein [Sanguibacter antarcticus]